MSRIVGRPGGRSRDGASKWVALAATSVMLLAAGSCGLGDPTSPNSPAALTGQNPNQTATFQGSISLSGGGEAPADGLTDFIFTATLSNNDDTLIANGAVVNFATSMGSVRAYGADPATAMGSTSVIAFDGRASVAVRSLLAGTATVTAFLADVAASSRVRFRPVQIQASVALVFRLGDEDLLGVSTVAPTEIGMVATVTGEDDAILPGIAVRFQIVRDSTAGSGQGKATVSGPPVSNTSADGEAFNTLRIEGAGNVTVVAKVIDPVLKTVVVTSNQIVAETTQVTSDASLTLTLESGALSLFAEPPFETGLTVVAVDRLGSALAGVEVKFKIIIDSDRVGDLANSGLTITDSAGQAFNTVTVSDVGQVVVVADLIDRQTRQPIARSNEVVVTGTFVATDNSITLETSGGDQSVSATAPYTETLIATAVDLAGDPAPGVLVRFSIISDLASIGTLASDGTTSTNTDGEAINTITVSGLGTVIVVAEVLDARGRVLATSNQAIFTGE